MRLQLLPRLVLGLAFVLLASPVLAQPRINSLSPDWIQRGTTQMVTLTGERLGSITGLVFNGASGLSGRVILPVTPIPAVRVETASRGIRAGAGPKPGLDKSLAVAVSASAEAALGDRELRVMSADGISQPLSLTVGAVPLLLEREPNNTPEQAQAVTPPLALQGVISAATEQDTYRFRARKGEQFVLEVQAQSLGSPLDSSLAVLDAQGRELARNEDARGFDSLLAFTAPADGDYLAQIRDFQYRGAGDYRYRLFLTSQPYVESVFPLGGQRGRSVEIQLTGHNLGGVEKMVLDLDSEATIGRQEIRLNTPRGLSNPIQFDVQELADVMETEPNDAATNANRFTFPRIINGRLQRAGDVDRFVFKAAAEGRVTIAVEARRYGSALDAFVAVYDGNSLLAQNDDADGADARLEIQAVKDRDYTILVRDLTSRGGDNFGYRLSVWPPAKPEPTLTARFYPDAVRVHRGGRTRVRCEVVRQAFDGPVWLSLKNPPAGISAESIFVPAGRGEGDLLISASEETLMGTVPLFLEAKAVAGLRELRAVAAATTPDRVFKQGFLSVLRETPFTLDAVTLAVNTEQLQSATLEVQIRRRDGFAGDIKLTPVGFALGRETVAQSFDFKDLLVKGDAARAQLKLNARVNAESATRQVYLRGESVVDGETVVQFSQPMTVTVTPIPFVLSATPAKLSLNVPPAGSTNVDEVELKVQIERRGFAGELPLSLGGLPEGVRVTGTNVPANATEAILKFLATAQTPAISNATVTLQASAMFNDRLFRHKAGGIKVVVTPPALEIASTNSPAGK